MKTIGAIILPVSPAMIVLVGYIKIIFGKEQVEGKKLLHLYERRARITDLPQTAVHIH